MSVLASQLYQGGSSCAVECLVCSTTSTSGSWRPGWSAPNGRVNLCNKCGQRWQKAGKPGSIAALEEAERCKAGGGIKRQAPQLAGYAADGHNTFKRLRVPSLVLTPAPRPLRRLSSCDSPASSDDTQSLDRSHSFAAAATTTPAVAQWHGRRFVSYCVQSLISGNAKHAAFWVQDVRGESTLAVVGTDARMTGHFVYASCSAFVEACAAPALRCTNRATVEAWLAGLGCTQLVAESAVRLPELSAAEKRRVLSPEHPVWARPAALSGTWHGIREESGLLTDGRHFKRFWLLGAGGAERLVVSGVDSVRKDRRYKYLAQEELGAFAFENSREVLGWINHALQRSPQAPLEPEQTRCPHLLQEAELGSVLGRQQAAVQLPPSLPMAQRTALPAATSPGGSGGKVRPLQPKRQAALGADAAGEDQRLTPTPAGAMPPLPFKIRLLAPRLCCSACGLDTHTSAECLLAATSPLALIRTASLPGVAGCGHHRTLSLLLFAEGPSPRGGYTGACDSSGSLLAEEGVWQALPTPQMLSREQLQDALRAEACSIHRAITPRVQQAFAQDPVLLAFASATPSTAAQEAFTRWARKLAGHVSDIPPPLPTCAEDTPVGGWSWTPTSEALSILQEISSLQVNLSLLHSTGISPAVAQLRNHRNREVADAADGIVACWRAAAVSVLEQATDALQCCG